MIRLLLVIFMLPQLAGALQSSAGTVRRLPLQKKEIILRSPTNYANRFVGMDPGTGKEVHYDPKPRVVLLDARSGAYGLKWIGYDRKEKTIIYHRPDAIDVVISASVKSHSSGRYLYTYAVHNLQTSAQNVFEFAVQSFADEVTPLKMEGLYVGPMSNTIQEMREGRWLDFAVLGVNPGIAPGRTVEHKLLSPAPPGLVECRAHGITGMKGVGEEPPQELENVLPGYEAWPHGYTVGPIDNLKLRSPRGRINYIRKKLGRFQQLGWMISEVAPWYKQNLKGDNIEGVFKQATIDLNAGRITSEFAALIEFLK